MTDTNTDRRTLDQELDRVGGRYRRLLLWTALAICWVALALAGAAALAWARGAGYAIPGALLVALLALPVVFLPIVRGALKRVRNPVWVAHRIERRFPDLDARLLAAVEQRPDESTGRLGYLQQDVIAQAIQHARQHGWERIVSGRKLRAAKWGQWAAFTVFAIVIGTLAFDLHKRPSQSGFWLGGIARRYDIKVEPADTSLERGSGLLVLARFSDDVPTDVQLAYRDADGKSQQMQMSKSLDDPVFAARVPSVDRDLTYSVRYADNQTRWFKVSVFDYPDLKQADARLKFPEYTKLSEKLVEDTRAVTAVEGTRATITFRLNKPVARAQLIPAGAAPGKNPATRPVPAPLPLVVDPNDPSVYTIAVDMKESQRLRLELTDAEGRGNKHAPELTLNVTPNAPPELKLAWPGRDVDVSPIQELAVRAQVWDDFGVNRVGLSYAIAGREPQEVVLAESVAGNEKRDVAHLVSLEQMKAEPDELLSYHLWVEDLAPDGAVRRSEGDMFFAEVRPFEQIYRQGQQPTEGEQQQQQQQQQSQGANAQQAEQLAELQKQIISATWKVIRRETRPEPTAQLSDDAKLLHESQTSVRKQAAAMAEQLEDARSKQHLQSVLKYMDQATKELNTARNGPTIPALRPALSAEQAAYQQLLKLRAREHEVVRGNRRQREQRANNSGAANRRQQQLDQLDLQQEENRYETQRRAQQEQQNDPAQREDRQVQSRLRELAQRQEDLNKQMKDLQAALQKAREEQQREELKRQLARLRDQQQEMLRDTDELRDRMAQPENQQRMADSREQLEQTREDVRKASEALEQGKVPDAAASGARAAEDLSKLRDDFRKSTAGQLAEDMNRMRDDARALDQKQQELAKELKALDAAEQRKLRDSGERQQVAQGLGQQREKLGGLLEDMKRTTEESEVSEPLLSRQLHDAAREASRQKTDQALDATKQMLDRGFVDEARQTETEASRGLAKLREGVERAAESVLGDETEALRRANDQLEQLARELERELTANGQAGASPATRPSRGRGQLAQNRPTTREGAGASAERREGEPPGDQQQPGSSQAQADGEQREGQRPGEGEQARADRPESQQGQQQGEGQQPGESQPGGQQQADARGGRQQQQPGAQQGENPGQGQAERQQQQSSARAQGGGGLRGGNAREDRQQADGQQPDGRQADAQARQPGERDLRDLLSPDDVGRAGGNERLGPMTGESFRDWSDRLRDVEEMVGDPRLRAEAARIRERARSLRAEANRHSKAPNWDLVRDFIMQPLVELRDGVADELMRRQTTEAMVPIDREPVPPQYVDKVREYYERLGERSMIVLAALVWGAAGWLSVALPIAALLLLLLTWGYWRVPTSRTVRGAAIALKLVAIAMLATCLLEPLITSNRARPGANLFVILADNSQSMTLRDKGADRARGDEVKSLLPASASWLAQLRQLFDLRQYAFDAQLKTFTGVDELMFDGGASNLGSALDRIVRRYQNRPLAGILLFTDGSATDPSVVARFVEQANGMASAGSRVPPIYPVLLGEDSAADDVSIGQVAVTQTSFEDAPVTITAQVTTSGYAGRSLVAKLLDESGKSVEQQDVSADRDGEPISVRFRVKPEQPGVSFYRVAVAPQGKAAQATTQKAANTDEATLANNTRLIAVDRGRGPYRVLYVGGRPNWEFKFLQRSLEFDPQVQLVGLLRIARREPKFSFLGHSGYGDTNPLFRGFNPADKDAVEQYDQPVIVRLGTLDEHELRGGFPKAADELFRYHAIVLDDVEAEFFTQDQMQLLKDFVRQRGGGLLMLGGQETFKNGKYERTPIGDLLPVYADQVAPVPPGAKYRLSLTREGLLEPWVRLRADEETERKRIDAMPPFQIVNAIRGIKPGATVLANAQVEGGATVPALVEQRFGQGRVGAMLVGDLWRWGLRRAEGAERDMEKAWRQTIRWLVADVPERVAITVVSGDDAENQQGTLKLRVALRDASHAPLDNGAVTVKVTGPDGKPLDLTAEASARESGVYEAAYVARQPGAYRAQVTALAADGSDVGKGATGWTSEPAAEEFRDLKPNRALLEQIARATGGQTIAADTIEPFVATLPTRHAEITEPHIRPMWHQPWVFATAICCLCAEWGLRRWKGMP